MVIVTVFNFLADRISPLQFHKLLLLDQIFLLQLVVIPQRHSVSFYWCRPNHCEEQWLAWSWGGVHMCSSAPNPYTCSPTQHMYMCGFVALPNLPLPGFSPEILRGDEIVVNL